MSDVFIALDQATRELRELTDALAICLRDPEVRRKLAQRIIRVAKERTQ